MERGRSEGREGVEELRLRERKRDERREIEGKWRSFLSTFEERIVFPRGGKCALAATVLSESVSHDCSCL